MEGVISFCVYLALILVADGLHCMICSSATNSDCDDPYKGDRAPSSSLSQGGFTSCLVSDNSSLNSASRMLDYQLENGILERLGLIYG